VHTALLHVDVIITIIIIISVIIIIISKFGISHICFGNVVLYSATLITATFRRFAEGD